MKGIHNQFGSVKLTIHVVIASVATTEMKGIHNWDFNPKLPVFVVIASVKIPKWKEFTTR